MTGSERDPGLQVERTYLAWQRTIALFLVVALFSLAEAWELGRDVRLDIHLAPSVVIAVTALVLAAGLRRRWHSTRNGLGGAGPGRPIAPVARPWMIALASGAVTAFGFAVAIGLFAG